MSAFLSRVGRTFNYISRVRVAICVGLAALTFFIIPDQAFELYIIYAQALASTLTADFGRSVFESPDFYLVLQLAFGIVATVSLCTVMWLCTLRLLLVSQQSLCERSTPEIIHKLVATGVSLLPAVALIIGFKRVGLAAEARDRPDLTAERYWLTVAAALLVVLILLNALTYCLLLRRHVIKIIDTVFSLRGFFGVCVLLLLFTASIVLNPVPLSSTFGSVALVELFLATLSYMLTAFASVTAHYRIPISRHWYCLPWLSPQLAH